VIVCFVDIGGIRGEKWMFALLKFRGLLISMKTNWYSMNY